MRFCEEGRKETLYLDAGLQFTADDAALAQLTNHGGDSVTLLDALVRNVGDSRNGRGGGRRGGGGHENSGGHESVGDVSHVNSDGGQAGAGALLGGERGMGWLLDAENGETVFKSNALFFDVQD